MIEKLFLNTTVVNIVWFQYHIAMTGRVVKNAAETAGMLTRIGRLSHGRGFVCGLTAAQWTALRSFACANRFSRTLSAFANYHATTPGTASQTVKSLVTKGFVTRTRSESNGRSVRFDLSERGCVVHGQDPSKELARAIAELPQDLQAELHAALERITGRMARESQRPSFGNCVSCLHLEECVPDEDNVADYFCREECQSIKESKLEEVCINYKPGAGVPKRGGGNPGILTVYRKAQEH